MADLKISQLSDGGASQAADEYVVARSGANYRIDGASVAAAATSVGTLTSLTVSGDLTVDTSTLKVDSTNNRVGIGTASPAYQFHIENTSAGATAFVGQSSTRGLFWQWLYNATVASAYGEISTYGGSNPLYIQAQSGGGNTIINSQAGNLGLGVTPSAWTTSFGVKAIDVGSRGAFYASDNDANVSYNTYFDGTNTKYKTTAAAARYALTGAHIWYIAASGTAGNNVSFTQAMTLDASGGLQVLNAIGVGNTAPTTSGAGITFPATQSASTNANTLDDYEEGTFTPSFAFGGGTTGITYNDRSGKYTKVGNKVTVEIFVELTNKGSSSGIMTITGLPFTVALLTGSFGASATAPVYWAFTSNFYSVMANASGNATTMSVLGTTAAGASPAAVTNTDVGNTSFLLLAFSYLV